MNRQWTRWLAIFALGFLLGSLLGARSVFDRVLRRWNPQRSERFVLQRYAARLDLNDEQMTQVARILADRRPDLDRLFSDMQNRYADLRKSTREDIRVLLTPSQQAIFDRMETESEKRYRDRSIFGRPK
jgi:hypothetical protein